MDEISKTTEELEEIQTTINGVSIKELLDKINDIVEWINGQS